MEGFAKTFPGLTTPLRTTASSDLVVAVVRTATAEASTPIFFAPRGKLSMEQDEE
jgi:hypothetical protein